MISGNLGVDSLFMIGDKVIRKYQLNYFDENMVGTVVAQTIGRGIYWIKWDSDKPSRTSKNVYPENWTCLESATSYIRDKKLKKLGI